MKLEIRREEERDYRKVEEITREAFWNLYFPGCIEHYLASKLRSHPDFIADMDLIAEYDSKIVGNIMYTKSYVENENGEIIDTLTFGPLCVLPEFHGQGIGGALVNHSLDIAHRSKAKAIIILGHPHHYCKYGFKSSRDYMITNTEGRYPFGQLVLELEKGVFEGKYWKFHYSRAYDDIDMKEAEEFDTGFPFRKKEVKSSQEEFSIAFRAYLD